LFAHAPFNKSACVDAGRGVSLEVDLVATAGVVLATEEVVEAHFIKRGYGGVRGDVSTDTLAGSLSARHHHGGVPADPAAVTALHFLVAGELGLVVHVNGVDVRSVEAQRHAQLSRS